MGKQLVVMRHSLCFTEAAFFAAYYFARHILPPV